MSVVSTPLTGAAWLSLQSTPAPSEIKKSTSDTRAWHVVIEGQHYFAKWYPTELMDTWATVEMGIAGPPVHPRIVPLVKTKKCQDGIVYLYEWIRGEDLSSPDARRAFAALPAWSRAKACLDIFGALEAICRAGYTIVDWYEGNMIYDFEAGQIWLYDWELCQPGSSFVLEMDSNYGSSRLMAPEEFIRGSLIDEVTLVYNLGRFATLMLPEYAEGLAEVLSKATYPARSGRYQTIEEFRNAFGRMTMRS